MNKNIGLQIKTIFLFVKTLKEMLSIYYIWKL